MYRDEVVVGERADVCIGLRKGVGCLNFFRGLKNGRY